MADIKTAVEFFNLDLTIDWSITDMKTEYTTFAKRVAESKQHHASWKYDKDERGRDHERKGEWIPLKIIEHLKNPQTGMSRGILQLSQLAGIAGYQVAVQNVWWKTTRIREYYNGGSK